MNLVYFADEVSSISTKTACTFQIDEKINPAYSGLQWALNSSNILPNEIYARQNECHKDLSIPEFLQYGTTRAGHRLQYRNIISSLVSEKMDFKHEPVFQIILQSIWEAGLRSCDSLREDHRDFMDSEFAQATIDELRVILTTISQSWNDSFVLLSLVTLSARIVELSEDEQVKTEAATFLRDCRNVATKWIEIINKLLDECNEEPERIKLLDTLVNGALCLAMTYAVSRDNAHYVMSTSEDLKLWLEAVTTLHDNVFWNPQVLDNILSLTKKSLLRYIADIGITIESQIMNVLKDGEMKALNEFASKRWRNAESFESDWKPYSALAHPVYVCNGVLSNNEKHSVAVDLLFGKFLVDGLPVSRLTNSIVSNSDYQRTFGTVNFRVQPENGNVFNTLSEFDGHNYTFKLKSNGQLLVTEVYRALNTVKTREMLTYSLFREHFPHFFAHDCSHWLNRAENVVEFRPKCFQHVDFFKPAEFKLCLTTKKLIECSTRVVFWCATIANSYQH